MSLRLFDHHIHSDRSDGTVSLADRAKTVAIRPHGISDHYPWRDKLRNEDDVKRYLDDATRLGLRVGIEYDLGVAPPLSAGTREALHYVIGAIHGLVVAGERLGYDDAGDYVKGRRKTFEARDRFTDPAVQARIRERILEVVAEGIERDRIDILGHPTFSPTPRSRTPRSGRSGSSRSAWRAGSRSRSTRATASRTVSSLCARPARARRSPSAPTRTSRWGRSTRPKP